MAIFSVVLHTYFLGFLMKHTSFSTSQKMSESVIFISFYRFKILPSSAWSYMLELDET